MRTVVRDEHSGILVRMRETALRCAYIRCSVSISKILKVMITHGRVLGERNRGDTYLENFCERRGEFWCVCEGHCDRVCSNRKAKMVSWQCVARSDEQE